jgi:hypothetical protein
MAEGRVMLADLGEGGLDPFRDRPAGPIAGYRVVDWVGEGQLVEQLFARDAFAGAAEQIGHVV